MCSTFKKTDVAAVNNVYSNKTSAFSGLNIALVECSFNATSTASALFLKGRFTQIIINIVSH